MSTAALDTPPDQTSCIDVRIGRVSTSGNDALYCRLLRMFGAGQRDALQRFRAALLQGDTATATRHAHNLRTNAAALGMTRLSELALRLESAYRAGAAEHDEEALLADLDDALACVMTALQTWGDTPPHV